MKTVSLILTSIATFTAGAALAHTELAATVPEDRAMIATAPENVQLTFSEPVRLTALSIQRDGAQKQSLGPLPSETTEKFSVALPTALDEGHYVVTWRALSEDTHVMSGEFMFAVGSAGSHAEHMNHDAEHSEEHSEHMNQDHHDDHTGVH
jgi:copper transport protein